MDASASEDDQADRRLNMVNGQLRTTDVTDVAVLAAFLAVPRERFVAPAFAKLAYVDQDAPSAGAAKRRLLAPRTLARLIQAATVRIGDRALTIGCGAGYSAALLAYLGAEVVALEADKGALAAARAALAEYSRVTLLEGDLAAGAPAKSPFDAILINGVYQTLPPALFDQLADGGRLVGLDGRGGAPRATLLERSGTSVSERTLFDAAADLLPGFERAPGFVF